MERGDRVVVTGVGGGVALMAVRFCVALGAKVVVTSGSEAKIDRAVKELGVVGGVSYKSRSWAAEAEKLLEGKIDVVIDGAGGEIVEAVQKSMAEGGRVVVYGITTMQPPRYTVTAMLKNVDLLGSTLGSRKEFREMVEFVGKEGVRPVVDRVGKGLEVGVVDELFGVMKKGEQFGKLVVRIREREEEAKL